MQLNREGMVAELRLAAVRDDLVRRMADALQPLPTEMLGSGTARAGRYQTAKLVNFRDRERLDPQRLNAHAEGLCHNQLDRAAVDFERTRRVQWPTYEATGW